MSEADILEIARRSLIVLLKLSGPFLFVSLMVGLVVALIQALTQIQEMTLVFVPKIITIFLTLLFILPFLGSTMSSYMRFIADRIVSGGG